MALLAGLEAAGNRGIDCHSPPDMEKVNGNEMIVPVKKLKRVNGSWNVNHIITIIDQEEALSP